MKSILYVGATLMIGASIYGFVDYRKTSNSQEFENMYKAEEPEPVVLKTEVKIPATDKPVVEEKKKSAKPVIARKKTTPRKKTKEVAVEENEIFEPVEKIEIEAPSVETEMIEPAIPEKEIKLETKKRISTKMFSRGSMEEKYVEKKKKKN
jgi:hypothetical protein